MIVVIDSGSSDLWVYPPSKLQLTNRTSIHGNLSYGEGSVQGSIDFAELKIGSYTIPSQAFINVQNYTEEGGLFEQGIYGILGLAFDNSSTADILLKQAYGVNNTLGLTPLSNIFQQNGSIPNFISIQLGRADDLASTLEGEFTISEYIPRFSNISNAPKLPRFPPTSNFERWTVLVDGVTVHGKSYPLNSTVAGTPKGSSVAVLDTGYTLPPLPRPLVDFIYGNISGAVYDKEEDVWIVPCLNTTDLEFTLGGDAFVIHPLDITNLTTIELPNGSSVTFCFNTYQPFTLDSKGFSGFDMILGDAFLRNVYALFDYGEYNNTDGFSDQSYVRLLSTTNGSTAYSDFVSSRNQTLQHYPPELPPSELLKALGDKKRSL
ncbi:hypothetical protein JAAARDRAFT_171578 [Jaapia argillacea MUCL 33604]|uniref:Peptidase A1 domain-containing protein n=1 Tax=Jaapia argillacea MUCL 33604 TaxID=933084 RepID=A0A067Q2U8_9AGAM|nr:hypothetical protein JAAARDRAFT_171578 [Jaapia argillacea MUCL 33604]